MLTTELPAEIREVAERSKRIVAAIKAATVGPMPIDEQIASLLSVHPDYAFTWALSFLWGDDGHVTPIAVVYGRNGCVIHTRPASDEVVQAGERLGDPSQMTRWKQLAASGRVQL